MTNDSRGPTDLAAAIRLATWILPSHRKEWAGEMLNEMAYIRSRRRALYWAFGCALFAIRERASHEFASTFTTRRILKSLLGVSAAVTFLLTGVYMVQKPYQRERILITVLHSVGAATASHIRTVR
ncbi:MAG: hypothetical protein KGM46_10205 [Pseudomonadota bacterium]|jgi:hypothetical protein|nr:hypothetical protein [Xanthomonadaceae bacterium]MDE2247584.1 hypothetical protein [Xanthomonadaceae bacterium]MDE3211104.1 hypothetical protein [Pseudomonadota bacterium]